MAGLGSPTWSCLAMTSDLQDSHKQNCTGKLKFSVQLRTSRQQFYALNHIGPRLLIGNHSDHISSTY